MNKGPQIATEAQEFEELLGRVREFVRSTQIGGPGSQCWLGLKTGETIRERPEWQALKEYVDRHDAEGGNGQA